MEFIVKFQDGTQEGPLDQETLRKRVEADKVLPNTQIRNAMLNNWKEASELEFLYDDFTAQAKRLAERKETERKEKGLLGKLFSSSKEERPAVKPKEQNSTFVYEYLPRPASITLRLCAAAFDWLLLGLLALILLGIGMSTIYVKALTSTQKGSDAAIVKTANAMKAETPQEKANFEDIRSPSTYDDSTSGFRPGSLWTDSSDGTVYACLRSSPANALWCDRAAMNSCFHKLFAVFAVIALLYFGLSLGFLSQTFGMWFWGIFIVKDEKGKEPVLPLRAFAFALLSLTMGFLMPLVSFIMPDKRAAHDLITGVRLIGIAAKPKA